MQQEKQLERAAMSNLPMWLTIKEAATYLNEQSGESYTESNVIELGAIGKLKIGAYVQDWKGFGNGELKWGRPDGSPADFISDGLVPLSQMMCEILLKRPTVSSYMAESNTYTFDRDGNQVPGETLRPALDSPQIGREHLRIPRSSIVGFLKNQAAGKRQGGDSPNGVPYMEIINHFRLDDSWKEKLRKPDRSKDYSRAHVSAGVRAGRSRTLNPAIFGALLIKNEPNYSVPRVSIIIKNHFSAWLDEWEAESKDLTSTF